jgi:hypothetical protein
MSLGGVGALILALALAGAAGAQEERVKVEITVLDAATRTPVPCRIELDNACGAAERGPDQLVWRDRMTLVSGGTARLELPPGRYTYEVERGLESAPLRGTSTCTAPSRRSSSSCARRTSRWPTS